MSHSGNEVFLPQTPPPGPHPGKTLQLGFWRCLTLVKDALLCASPFCLLGFHSAYICTSSSPLKHLEDLWLIRVMAMVISIY